MGLRGKILALFIISFGLMSVVALTLLQSSLKEGFSSIEHQQATEQMAQLSRNLNGELDRLSQMTFDWANWDDAYNFIQHPSKDFTERHLMPAAMKEIEIKLFVILDNRGNTVFSEAVNLMNGEAENAAGFIKTVNNIRQRIAEPGSGKMCGLDISIAGPMLLCWQSIRKSDLTGTPAGTIVMGRLLNSALINKIQTQSNIRFDLSQLPLHDSDPQDLTKSSVEPEHVEFSRTEPHVLNALLYNFNGQPILMVRLQYPTDVSQRGAQITWKVLGVVLIVTVLTALIQFAGIQMLLIRRLQKIGRDLNSIWRNGRWAERLTISKKTDEFSELSHAMNRMLGLIRKQGLVLEAMAHTDNLTNIANRRAFDQRILIEMSLHKRNQTALSLLFVSVDYFKEYNDEYGYPAGDDILIEISKLLTQVACRPSDLPARISEEEFAVILPSTNLEGAKHVAELLKANLEQLNLAHLNSPISDRVTLSTGISSAGDETLDSFMNRVAGANQTARQSGKNRICCVPA